MFYLYRNIQAGIYLASILSLTQLGLKVNKTTKKDRMFCG